MSLEILRLYIEYETFCFDKFSILMPIYCFSCKFRFIPIWARVIRIYMKSFYPCVGLHRLKKNNNLKPHNLKCDPYSFSKMWNTFQKMKFSCY